jgi:hypothetical protein
MIFVTQNLILAGALRCLRQCSHVPCVGSRSSGVREAALPDEITRRLFLPASCSYPLCLSLFHSPSPSPPQAPLDLQRRRVARRKPRRVALEEFQRRLKLPGSGSPWTEAPSVEHAANQRDSGLADVVKRFGDETRCSGSANRRL